MVHSTILTFRERWGIALVLLAGCEVAPLDVEPPGEYTEWGRIEIEAPVVGHGEEARVVYANDVARTFAGGAYPVGSILIEEVGGPLVLMRKREDGWLFSMSEEPNGDEFEYKSCWSRCHVAAPLDGAFLDYSRAMK